MNHNRFERYERARTTYSLCENKILKKKLEDLFLNNLLPKLCAIPFSKILEIGITGNDVEMVIKYGKYISVEYSFFVEDYADRYDDFVTVYIQATTEELRRIPYEKRLIDLDIYDIDFIKNLKEFINTYEKIVNNTR